MKILRGIGWFLACLSIFFFVSYFYQNVEVNQLDKRYRTNQSGNYVELSKGFTRYEIAGPVNAEIIVLVHGYGVASYVWDPTVNFLLDSGYRVLRFDLYGHGSSDRPDEIYGIELFSEQLNELLTHLKVNKPFHLLGLSMGGSVVAGYTHKYPEKVKSLILQDPLVKKLGQERIYPLNVPLIGEYIYDVYVMPKNIDTHVNTPGKGIVYETYGDKYLEQAKINGFRKAMLSGLRYMASHDYKTEYQKLAKTTMPKLLIWGSEDKTIPISNAKILLNLMPNLNYQIINGAGHVPSMEVPEKFNAILLPWLIQNKSNTKSVLK